MKKYFMQLFSIQLLSIICLFCCFNSVRADYTINVNNSDKVLKSIKLNNVEFVPFEQLIKLFNKDVNYDANINVCKTENFSVNAKQSNFFIFFQVETDDSEEKKETILQLNSPAILHLKTLYVPVISFFSGLKSIINFNCDITPSMIFLETNENFLNFFGITTKKTELASAQQNHKIKKEEQEDKYKFIDKIDIIDKIDVYENEKTFSAEEPQTVEKTEEKTEKKINNLKVLSFTEDTHKNENIHKNEKYEDETIKDKVTNVTNFPLEKINRLRIEDLAEPSVIENIKDVEDIPIIEDVTIEKIKNIVKNINIERTENINVEKTDVDKTLIQEKNEISKTAERQENKQPSNRENKIKISISNLPSKDKKSNTTVIDLDEINLKQNQSASNVTVRNNNSNSASSNNSSNTSNSLPQKDDKKSNTALVDSNEVNLKQSQSVPNVTVRNNNSNSVSSNNSSNNSNSLPPKDDKKLNTALVDSGKVNLKQNQSVSVSNISAKDTDTSKITLSLKTENPNRESNKEIQRENHNKSITVIQKNHISNLDYDVVRNTNNTPDENRVGKNRTNNSTDNNFDIKEEKEDIKKYDIDNANDHLNHSLPPFRKYSIPDSINRKKIKELKRDE